MPQLIPHLQPRYNDDVTNQECNSATPLTNINNDNKSKAVLQDQATGDVGSNVNEASPRQCRSTRSKYAGSKVKLHSGANFTESMESLDSQECGDSSFVPASPKMKSKRNKNQLGGQMEQKSEGSVPVLSGRSMLSGVVEYGTVLLFTCSKSCWQGAPQAETVLVQHEVL